MNPPSLRAWAGQVIMRGTTMLVVTDYRCLRIEIVAQFLDSAWNAGVRIRRTLSEMTPHVEQVTCRKASAIEAEQSGETWARRRVDRHGRSM